MLFRSVDDAEHAADKITAEVNRLLHTTFITPIDREQIHGLINGMDDIVDLLQDATETLQLYDVNDICTRQFTNDFGGQTQGSPRMMAQTVDVIVTALPSARELRDAVVVNTCAVTGLAVRQSRIGTRRKDASDATQIVAEAQESYDLGPMTWRILDAAQSIELVDKVHADGLRLAVAREDLGAASRQVEARHQVGDHHALVAVNFADALLAIGGVADGQHRVGMGVVDEAVGQAAVQDGLDGRRGCRRLQHVRNELVHHLRIGKGGKARQLEDMVEAHGRKALRLDGLEVPAAALYVKDGLFFAEDILLAAFDGGVAAAVQHQGLVASQQSRGVHAQAQVTLVLRRFLVVP